MWDLIVSVPDHCLSFYFTGTQPRPQLLSWLKSYSCSVRAKVFCLLLGPPGINCWFSSAPVFQWCCSTPQGSPGVGRNTFLSSSHLCFIIVPTDDLIPKTRRCRNQHSMAFQTPIANTDVYKGSFFPQTIRDWNALPDSLISSAEDAEDCVAKFTSLVRARD